MLSSHFELFFFFFFAIQQNTNKKHILFSRNPSAPYFLEIQPEAQEEMKFQEKEWSGKFHTARKISDTMKQDKSKLKSNLECL